MDITQYISDQQKRIEIFLDSVLPHQKNELHMAMRYATLGGGKRFRPLLVFAAGDAFGADEKTLNYVAAAVEMIHCYSLIHDDLPAMDDDALRRGKPSCHKAYNEGTAILAGDALQSLAFELLTSKFITVSAEMEVKMIRLLAKASGPNGMALGQELDLYPDDIINLESITSVHLHKTGAIIQASVLLGARAAGVEDKTVINALADFGQDLGLAYQIQDDILDLETSAEHITEIEAATKDNLNFSALIGTGAAEEEAKRCYDRALMKLREINLQDSYLAKITSHMMQRDH